MEDSIRLYPLAVAQQIWGELMVPVSLSFSPGPLEYFALLARSSGPVLLGLSSTVQGLFRKSASDVLPVATMVTVCFCIGWGWLWVRSARRAVGTPRILGEDRLCPPDGWRGLS